MSGTVYIGTSGWSYAHWRGTFYPESLSEGELLSYYAERFDTVEINNSFYQLPAESTLAEWHEKVSGDFRFATKASRYATHMKKLKNPRQSTEQFFEVIETLGDRLGPILFQLPPNWSVNVARLEEFAGVLPEEHRYAFEFRDESWFSEDTKEVLERHNSAFCIYHISHRLSPLWVTADFAYVRLHGPHKEAYRGSYHEETLKGWAKQFTEWAESGIDVYCYFDNDEEGYAPQNALTLKEIITQ